MDIFLLITSILLAIAAGYLGYRAYILAGIVVDQKEYLDQLEFTYGMLLDKTAEAYEEMNRIDIKGSFKSDDEVGTTFALLKQVIDSLYEEGYGTKKEKE